LLVKVVNFLLSIKVLTIDGVLLGMELLLILEIAKIGSNFPSKQEFDAKYREDKND